MLRFGVEAGSAAAATAARIRERLQETLEQEGATVRPVALDPSSAAAKMGCTSAPEELACLERLWTWLAASPKTAAATLVLVEVRDLRFRAWVYDGRLQRVTGTFEALLRPDDLILPVALPDAIAQVALGLPAPEPTAEEEAQLAALEEPEQTPEERAAEQRALDDAAQNAASKPPIASMPDASGPVEVDLRSDFRAFCREEPRRRRASRDAPKDLRPACARGPIWGYWQPRAYVALGLVSASAALTLGFYAAALGSRAPYRRAVDDVDDFVAAVGGDPTRDPTKTTLGEVRYETLAYEVSERGARMRQLALTGDVMLGVTALLGTVLAVIIVQDRREARAFLRDEKRVRAISRWNVAPWLGGGIQGLGLVGGF